MQPPEYTFDEARLAALDELQVLDTSAEPGFDDIVHLATQLCDAPVALVSLVARDRQWFKAKVGFSGSQTDLDRSVCAHALVEPDLLVIDDLSEDPRTRNNPLVTGEPFIRFYAGAPLRTPEGHVVGSLCTIDTKPRPGGLDERQKDNLRALARQVTTQLELRRSLARQREADARHQQILASAVDYGILTTDLDGLITSWSEGAVRIMGWPASEVLGRNAAMIFTKEDRAVGAPEAEMGTATALGRAADERWRLRQDGSLFWALGETMPLRAADGSQIGFLKIMRDRTGQRLADQRLEESEGRYRGLFEAVDAGFCVIEMRYDESGRPVDYRFLETNPAFEKQAGFGNPVGRWMREIAPNHEQVWFDRYGEVARTGAPTHFEQRGEALGRDYDARAYRVGRPERHQVAVLFTDISERRRMQEALRDSEAYWRGLFERLNEGFVVGEAVRDETGRMTDWRYVDVNAAWAGLMGVDATTVLGRTVREVFPGVDDIWVEQFATVLGTREPITFTRQVGTPERWYEGRGFHLSGDRFGIIFLEVTDRVLAESRRNALLELGDRLRDLTTTAEMTWVAAEIVGRTVDADRAGFGRLDATGDYVDVEPDWTADGMASIVGRHRLGDYGSGLRDAVLSGAPVVVEDVTADLRTADRASSLLALGIGSLVNLPVQERGRRVAILIVHTRTAHHWTEENLVFLRNVADRVEAGTARLAAEAQQRVLNLELSHRMKNTMAMIQAVAAQTLRRVTEKDAVEAFNQRLHALSSAHDVLLRQNWTEARMDAVVRGVIETFGQPERFVISGPDVTLGPRPTLSLSLVLHELTTNAMKHGSLSAEGGSVVLTWSLEEETGGPDLVLRWQETGGPPASEPTRKGFGSRLIRTGFGGTGSVSLHFASSGLEAEMRAPLAHLQES